MKGWTSQGYFYKNCENGWIKVQYVSGFGYEGNFYDGSMHDETICILEN